MDIKKVILGEKMPDKEDPKYKERYEREVEAGRKAARFLRLDKAAYHLQGWAQKHSGMFFFSVLLLVVIMFFINIYRIATATQAQSKPSTAVERQEKMLHRHGIDKRHAPAQEKQTKEFIQPEFKAFDASQIDNAAQKRLEEYKNNQK